MPNPYETLTCWKLSNGAERATQGWKNIAPHLPGCITEEGRMPAWPGRDHVTFWNHQGRVFLISEPYANNSNREAISTFAESNGLQVKFGEFSPYNPGNTVLFMIGKDLTGIEPPADGEVYEDA